MLKSHEREGKTAAIPNRVMQKIALSMIPMQRVERKDFLGYEGSVEIEEGTITIRASSDITPKDMRMFHFVLSQWQAMRKTEQSDILYVDIPKVLEALGVSNRTVNREMVIAHLQRMMGVHITYQFKGGSLTFSTLDFIRIERFDIVSIRVSKTFEEAVIAAKQRYININQTMQLRSGYAIELFNLLQIDGSGVDSSGLAIPANSITHERVCNYLFLEYGSKEALEEVRRAFRNLGKIGFPKYKNVTISNQVTWRQEGKNLSKKTIKAIAN